MAAFGFAIIGWVVVVGFILVCGYVFIALCVVACEKITKGPREGSGNRKQTIDEIIAAHQAKMARRRQFWAGFFGMRKAAVRSTQRPSTYGGNQPPAGTG